MAEGIWNGDNRYVVQPAESSADTFQLVARTATNVVVSATSAVSFTSASLSRNILTVVVNGTTYYVPASLSTW